MSQISVIYEGEQSSELDTAINKAMKNIRAIWYAQGYDFTTKQREICFDLEEREGGG